MSATLPVRLVDAQEFALYETDFERVRSLIHRVAGISLHDSKQAMVYSRLSRRLRELGLGSFSAYLDHLESTPHQPQEGLQGEWQAFVNCLTTNLTSFFREPHHFDALEQDLRARSGKPLRLWCCAASTGEEPYSLAMRVVETLGPAAAAYILSTDIDSQVLERAQRGIYALNATGLSAARMHRHFLRGTGGNAGSIKARPEITRLLEFAHFNLMNPSWNALGDAFDFVFCRNVMIYFDAATQRQVLKRIHTRIKPGGLLYVGHSESFGDMGELFRLRGQTVYERV